MRPTIALCLIVKNEAHNLGPLLQSVKGCFDEIHITDTGSTDNTLGFIEKINEGVEQGAQAWTGIPKIQVHHFEWVNDFAAARNYSFMHATTDFVMWLDADDELSSAEKFIEWRDTVMHSAHYWFALYNYAFDDKGKVECQFIRERVVKRNYGFNWRYFIHEGLVQTEGKSFWPNKAHSWCVNHRRTVEDRKADHGRNLKLFEMRDFDSLEPRMKFYYGKELVENGFPEKAGKPLMDALKDERLEPHDRVLAFQYAAQSAFHAKAYAEAIDVCMQGLRLFPSRAEYWCLIGDCHTAMGKPRVAIQSYKFALHCTPDAMGGITVTYAHAYHDHPHFNIATLAINTGDLETAWSSIQALKESGSGHVKSLEQAYYAARELGTVRSGLAKSEDVVITCPPYGAVTDWDENTLKEKGHGGSETAAIEVARWIIKKTGRPVKIFQPRVRRERMDSGVEYIPVAELQGYFQNVEPKAHIAWRHAVRLTRAPSFVWSHDLLTMGADKTNEYDYIFALSEFHKNYLHQCMNIPKEKIKLMVNGINPDDFKQEVEKQPLKVIFSSSPDRGLDRAIRIVEKAREISGLDIQLHSFYGFENMRKSGNESLIKMASDIEAMIDERDWVNHHGFVNKHALTKHFKEASTWIYPANFIETFCITAYEALCAGTYPIVRDMGALKYTMSEAIDKGMCEVIETDCETDAEVGIWANRLVDAIIERKYTKVWVDPQNYSWEKAADLMIKELGL